MPIASDLGLKVYKTKLNNEVSGMLKRDKELGGSSGFAIFVNADHPVTRRRFTIAHEIAHYILHRDLIADGIKEDKLLRSGLPSHIETEANRFAANILMPWALINEEMRKTPEAGIEDLARTFNVSPIAMSIRLGVPYE